MKQTVHAATLPAIIFFCLSIQVFTDAFAARGITAVTDVRHALVIGNGDYRNAPLKNPVNDALDMAVVLEKLGFSVSIATNANQRTMEEAIQAFGKKLLQGGTGLFFFAGHGIQVNGRNYLIPIGARIESESDVKYETVDAGRILGKMDDAQNDINIVILDACRNNPYARSFRSSGRGLAQMDAPRGSLLAYSTAPGSVAADGDGRNSTYTKYLLKHISSPDLPIELTLKRVREDVIRESGEKQVPWESSSLVGNFYFKKKKQSVSAPLITSAPPTKAVSNQLELERQKLEKERLELERMRLDIERQKLEAEKRKMINARSTAESKQNATFKEKRKKENLYLEPQKHEDNEEELINTRPSYESKQAAHYKEKSNEKMIPPEIEKEAIQTELIVKSTAYYQTTVYVKNRDQNQSNRDWKYEGKAPLQLKNLPPGIYIVLAETIDAGGYDLSHKTTVKVINGKKTELIIKFLDAQTGVSARFHKEEVNYSDL